ncbi:helix-turn-helix domain-containing protein [Flammeovirga agarivorans]|uniref:Helix-turn-helix transcriptional regulator n=1 Tax=Flammeovirga agarivorans TaxID=2726742 RepID=A0A7X8XVZ8_9BACT|nr:helix-turn-helix domain-containing protein [Flammeovirga agarivorans]NLR91744.1 helix-turn-helix transcriptional regulator [Flammeovirga agarivorans]
MIKTEFHIDQDLAPYVNCIMTGKNSEIHSHTNIPLYADGYPGIMFQQSDEGFYLLPQEKELSELFLYGQTIRPISLDVKGPHNYVVVQLYPFASKYLLNIDPKVLNDECYDLLQIEYLDIKGYQKQLRASVSTSEQVEIISTLMRELINKHNVVENDSVQKAISIILRHQGQLKVKTLLNELSLTERTLERNFKSYVGLSPKQFAKIIQFQFSLNQLTAANYEKLTDVGLDSGFTDQSHFIRTFKNYTGQTPSFYCRNL